MRRYGTAALLALAMAWGTMTPQAYAQAPGADWSLINSETVRYFLPGSVPPAPADPATGAQASALSAGSSFNSNEWLLVSTEQVHDFLPDGDWGPGQIVSSTFVSSRNEQQRYQAESKTKLSDAEQKDPPVAEPDSSKWKLISQDAHSRRYAVGVTQFVRIPFKIVDRFGIETRKVDVYDVTYRMSATVISASGEPVVVTRTYTVREERPTAWVKGPIDPGMDVVLSAGIDTRTDRLPDTYYVTDLVAGALSVPKNVEKAGNASFLSDRGAGASKSQLSGSKQRAAFKANDAVASVAVKQETDEHGSTVIVPANPTPAPTPTPTPPPAPPTAGTGGNTAPPTAPPSAPPSAPITKSDWVGTWWDGSSDYRWVFSNKGDSVNYKIEERDKKGKWKNYDSNDSGYKLSSDFKTFTDNSGSWTMQVSLSRVGTKLNMSGWFKQGLVFPTTTNLNLTKQ